MTPSCLYRRAILTSSCRPATAFETEDVYRGYGTSTHNTGQWSSHRWANRALICGHSGVGVKTWFCRSGLQAIGQGTHRGACCRGGWDRPERLPPSGLFSGDPIKIPYPQTGPAAQLLLLGRHGSGRSSAASRMAARSERTVRRFDLAPSPPDRAGPPPESHDLRLRRAGPTARRRATLPASSGRRRGAPARRRTGVAIANDRGQVGLRCE